MTVETILGAATLTSVGLAAFHHLGYPVLLKLAQRRFVSPPRPRFNQVEASLITLVIPAYEEAAFIGCKLGLLAGTDYPRDRLRVLVICDGCQDETAEIARSWTNALRLAGIRLTVIENRVNQGKVACLNQALQMVSTPLVAFSDVSADLPIDAFSKAAAWFQNPTVGVVAGGYRLENPMSTGEDAYWRYQSAVKRGEAALGAPLGVHGAFYMVRRELVDVLESDTINDDFILPMRIVAKGYRAIYDTDIDVVEREKASTSQDFRRRQRIAAGNLQQVIRVRALLHPKHKGIAACFLAGKTLRAVMAPILGLGFLGSALLAPHSALFAALFALHLLAAVIAGVGLINLTSSHLGTKLAKAAAYVMGGHMAGLLGGVGYITGRYRAPWRRAGLDAFSYK